MMPLTSVEAFDKYPDKVLKIIAALTRTGQPSPTPDTVSWFVMACHDDPEQPLDEEACATLMLTGELPCNLGLMGRIAGREACVCNRDLAAPGSLRSA